ncbi:MAG: MFS transporter [Methanolinea sp.]|nr:MFS transporter [Methanolinea sp.]
MRTRIILLAGVFSVMALSNAIVPVLPSFATGTSAQGAIFAAYFLGAFLLVLPAGIIADRVGETPLIRAGLLLTAASGILLCLADTPVTFIGARFVEGVGAGLFVPSALAFLNARPDHERMSGYFMGMLNLGLIVGLLLTGWLVAGSGSGARAGIFLFTGLSMVPLIVSLTLRPHEGPVSVPEPVRDTRARIQWAFTTYFWLWVSAVVMVGVTGAVTALHPEYTDLPPGLVSEQLALMNAATIASVLVTAHAHLPPVRTIRLAAIAMAGGVALTTVSPWGFLVIGWLAGMVMIAQLSFLADAGTRQGVLMGLFNCASYGGMTILPFIACVTADLGGFPVAYAIIAFFALFVALTIGRCQCRLPRPR